MANEASADLKVGGDYLHIRTGMPYLLQGLCLAKQGDGEWVPSVYYMQVSTGKTFCRDVVAFRNNFAEV